MHGESGYGLWTLVILNSAIFIIFAFSFTQPKSKTDWRSLGFFSAFILALFTEMYGFPLTIYFLSGWLSERFPDLNLLTHSSGHLWAALLNTKIDPHFHPIHLAANALIILGFVILSSSWKVLHAAQKNHLLATTGLYSRIRHPQYIGFIFIMFGFLVMWPTILTLAMLPILIFMYYKLAKSEEKVLVKEFGDEYKRYMQNVPAFIPKPGNKVINA
ncbi:Protein-S-isoprenylcysteine O-methyltransferase Ste14 [Nitrosomonas aestuarii]|uniref:Protein-S-isoprenylcysteine O-methyltransferase Ste14 n=1 Tax=Nitrosomonas aestuarii TaxID=52441 RepID=A0A1I4H186_9PROT|nr:isoprenylcysteine carboxylmethyltransferase family protein [Nitrosomonas aestuarii]SFL35141.1 Protein-S-isoprenylcysteine O-methyltransferase Ste14 [Nitrosomonas aestuarii]HNP51239.1 isoprenylcysteine carboxylmethyltransferase family protein [Nitrosomonas nitrosa]